jgi:hypothetical protein
MRFGIERISARLLAGLGFALLRQRTKSEKANQISAGLYDCDESHFPVVACEKGSDRKDQNYPRDDIQRLLGT